MKIQYLIDTQLSPELEALDFVDRYGGLVKTMNILMPTDGDNTVQKRYPVACNVSAKDCENTGIYQNLVPDDSKKSVVYWEEVTPMQNSGYTQLRDFYTKKMIGTARLVVWLNLNKLGISNCTDAILTLPPIEKIITKKINIIGGIYDTNLLMVQPKGMVKKSPKNIFGKYTYPDNAQYYLYPFDYYAIDVQFELHQCLKKGGVFPVNPSVDCFNK